MDQSGDRTPRVSKREVIFIPSGCSLVRLVMADPEVLPKVEQSLRSASAGSDPRLADAITVAKRLSALLRRKASESLSVVLDASARTPLKEFAAGLRRDIGANQAAFDQPWTTSPVEGQVNRLKMLKRTMYGRAGF